MKVLYLTNVPAPYRVDFFNELGKLCDLTVIYERHAASDRNSEWKSENSENFKKIFLKGINFKEDSAFCPTVVKWLNKKKFDVIVVGGYSTPTGLLSILTLKKRKIPFFLNCDGGLIKDDNSLVYWIKNKFIGSANYWLSTGDRTNKYLQHYGAIKEGIFVYPFTTFYSKDIRRSPIKKEEKIALQTELGLSNKITVLTVSRFIQLKGIDVLLRAWSKLPFSNIQLLIVGGGEEKEIYQRIIEDMKLENVILVDFKQKEELKKYYAASDFFVLPTRSDVWGLVINEAMSYGLPVISTEGCVSAVELSKYSPGVKIVPVGNENKLAEAIEAFIRKRDKEIEALSTENLEIISKYTLENMAQVHYDIFLKVKDNKR